MHWLWWLVIAGTVLGFTAGFVLARGRGLRTLSAAAREAAAEAATGQASPGTGAHGSARKAPHQRTYAFVFNAVNAEAVTVRAQIESIFRARALTPARWYETTSADPGTGQARQAMADGADVVIAVGGDGTVRAVAAALAGSGKEMGILPVGTGNILARNLDLDVADLNACLDVAMGTQARSIDVGRLRTIGIEPEHGAETADATHIFLVIAGIGFDAAMVDDTDTRLKKRVGWLAYFIAGVRHLHAKRIETTLTIDGDRTVTTHLRTLLVGNCGKLPGGIVLLPDATPDDGILDVAAIDTRAGLVGWAQLWTEVVVAQGRGWTLHEGRTSIGRIDHTSATRVHLIVTGAPQPIQVDGDVLGKGAGFEAWIEPASLRVLAPVPRLTK